MADENEAATTDNEANTSAADDQQQDGATQAETLYGESEEDTSSEESTAENEGESDDKDAESDSEDSDKDEKDEGEESEGEVKLEFEGLPEGMAIDEELLGKFQSYIKDNDLDQEQAQSLADLYKDSAIGQYNGIRESHEATVDKWFETSSSDEEIAGKDGSLFQENADLAKKAFDTFGTPELGEMLSGQQTGIGNHPEFVRFAMRIGKSISEDSMQLPNAAGGTGEKSQAETLYPDM